MHFENGITLDLNTQSNVLNGHYTGEYLVGRFQVVLHDTGLWESTRFDLYYPEATNQRFGEIPDLTSKHLSDLVGRIAEGCAVMDLSLIHI